jgi:hypothetical protein
MVRAWELLVEDSESSFDSDLEDLLIAAKANGIIDIEVDSLVDQLNGMGYAVTPDSLVSSIENHEHSHEFIQTVTLDKIILKAHSLDDDSAEEWEDAEVDAEKLASKTAIDSVKQKQDRTRQAGQEVRT